MYNAVHMNVVVWPLFFNAFTQFIDDSPKGHQTLIDVSALLQSSPLGSCLGNALRPSEINQILSSKQTPVPCIQWELVDNKIQHSFANKDCRKISAYKYYSLKYIKIK
jgi:hypothetical protein